MKPFHAALLAAALLSGAAAQAAEIAVTMHRIDANGTGAAIGSIRFADSAEGLIVNPDLAGLPPGVHGFHIHENADCGPGQRDGQATAGLAAGGHYDPAGTGVHAGPHGEGHLGDLPVLTVDATGKATTAGVVPRLRVADLAGRSVVIHAGGDTHSDQPVPLGGSGERIACGVFR